jgi:hypothetical protein
MPKSFEQNFREWVADNRYSIGPDIGTEPLDQNTSPTLVTRSSTQKHGSKNSE